MNTFNMDNDVVGLLNEIKGVTHQFDTKRNLYLSVHRARKAYYTCVQTQHQTDAEYLAVFTANIQVLEYYKAPVGESYKMAGGDKDTQTIEIRAKVARDASIAMAFLDGADPKRYNALRSDLANQQTRGNDQYPVDITAAYAMLVNFHSPPPQQRGQPNQTRPTTATESIPTDIGPHSFAQATKSTNASTLAMVAGTDGVIRETISCFSCNATGHYANNCPLGISLLQHAFVLTQANGTNRYKGIPKQ
jgi:Zinc knuckle